ncbi:hypothetical protein Q7P35_004776 [Cladosporium inversicolor]
MSSLMRWWKKDQALHTYVYAQVLLSLPFSVFGTYVAYQIQTVGFVIGNDGQGGPCVDFCIVEWAGSQMDVNSVLLYMNAFGIGLGGFVTLILSAYSDYWSRKHLLVTTLFIIYGVISIPVNWLQGYSNYNFQTLTALNIIFTISTNILVALLNIYIPYCMRRAAAESSGSEATAREMPLTTHDAKAAGSRTYGFKMVVKGAIANSLGALMMYIITIIIQETTTNIVAPGLVVTTAVGFLTIAGSSVVYLGLPKIPSKDASQLKQSVLGPMKEFLAPFKDLLQRRSMAILLISYTVYNDTAFAIASVMSQLYILELRPGTLEISLYALAATVSGAIGALGFFWIRPLLPFRLEYWLLVCYAIMVLIPAWGIIGFAGVNFGFKSRWEFYVSQFFLYVSGTVITSCFRVLFSEMVPAKNEVRWFGLQWVLSCATLWVNYVASAPLQNATHQLRFPLVLSIIFMVFAFVIEIARVFMPYFQNDQKKWAAFDKANLEAEEQDGTNISVNSNGARHSPEKVEQVDGRVDLKA